MVPHPTEKIETNHIILDTLYLTEVVNIPWDKVRKLSSKQEEIEKIRDIALSDLSEDLYEQLADILERGYTIFITDNGGRRNFWVDYVNDQNESIVIETESIKGNAQHVTRALDLANKLFQATLKKGKPYHREGWFGKEQPYYTCNQEIQLNGTTRLDQLLLDTTTMVSLKKQHSLYELMFKKEELVVEENDSPRIEKVIIHAQKFSKSLI